MTASRLLHVLNGDATVHGLRRSDATGTLAVWADILHEGPVPGEGTAPERWRDVRARYIAAAGYASYEDALHLYAEWDHALEGYPDFDEVVLWFEHDLFDQLILVRHLDWFARRDLGGTQLCLICIGHYPGVEPFHGLGQLSPDQLASLVGTRQRVTPLQTELARAAWRAFTGPDPTKLERLLEGDTAALPFLAGALRRLLQEFPSVENGLPRTERHILASVATGVLSPADLFHAVQRQEERVFMGDGVFWRRVEQLAAGPHPLLALDMRGREPHRLPDGLVRSTVQGRDVLAGTTDWVRRSGIDRWLGGVHLSGREVPWRWDERAGRLRPQGA